MVPRAGRMNRRVRCGPATDLRPAASMRTKEEPGHWGEGRARSRDPIGGFEDGLDAENIVGVR